MTVEKVLYEICKVLQSKKTLRLDEKLIFDIVTVRRPIGAGRKSILNIEVDRLRKKSVVAIPSDNENICCARAIVVGHAAITKNRQYNSIRNGSKPLQKTLALKLHEHSGVPIGPCGLDEIKKFEELLDVQIHVISAEHFNKIIKRKSRSPEEHICGESKCVSCKQFVCMNRHLCFLEQKKPKPSSEKLIFFDFEAMQETGEHIVNFAVLQYYDGQEVVIEGVDVIKKFCDFLFSKCHEGFTAIAHNLKGYDGQFILGHLLSQGIKPHVITNGSMLMSMEIVSHKIRLIDSLNFLPMPLSKFPKTVGLEELTKRYFPHLFNTAENQAYLGALPDVDNYAPNFMNPQDVRSS
ncbi:hypothetical protein AVEN_159755-1 [Araneus ventricosus]|uniref:DNA-directed DNA polymerase n=1 Tax=Araneus ventricosus TaxID=182803 RepID=A0A4Y2S252_ARAVE|nr:hypothetical protein AVEN_159755-1 [Araneus ventricosus]